MLGGQSILSLKICFFTKKWIYKEVRGEHGDGKRPMCSMTRLVRLLIHFMLPPCQAGRSWSLRSAQGQRLVPLWLAFGFNGSLPKL
jgi:hypothetical protein